MRTARKDSCRVASVQVDNSVNFDGNLFKALSVLEKLSSRRLDLIVFPECYLSGFSAKAKIMSKAALNKHLAKVQGYCTQTDTVVVLPTAFEENSLKYNAGFIISKEKISHVYKVGLTESENQFFASPSFEVQKIFTVKNYKYAVLICKEAQEEPWKYFSDGGVDFILWPGYWGWDLDDSWASLRSDGTPDKVFENQKLWRVPLIQSNFSSNQDSSDMRSGPQGLGIMVDSDNSLIKRASHLKEEVLISEIVKTSTGNAAAYLETVPL